MYKKKQRQSWKIFHQDFDNLVTLVKTKDLRPLLEGLNELSKALANGEEEPAPPQLSDKIATATFNTMADKIRMDSEGYDETCKRNKEARSRRASTSVDKCSSLNQNNSTQPNTNNKIVLTYDHAGARESERLDHVTSCWRHNIQEPTPRDIEWLESLFMDHTEGEILNAISIAGTHGKLDYPQRFVEKILKGDGKSEQPTGKPNWLD